MVLKQLEEALFTRQQVKRAGRIALKGGLITGAVLAAYAAGEHRGFKITKKMFALDLGKKNPIITQMKEHILNLTQGD